MRSDPERRADIRHKLLTYCKLDPWATVEVLRVLCEEYRGLNCRDET